MKDFIYTTIALSILALALIINCIKLNNRINELEDCIQQTYAELQEHKYKSSEFYTNDNLYISEKEEI